MKTISFIPLILIALLSSCQNSSDEMETITRQAERFVNHYYNYEFNQALDCCTPDSHPWIAFYASQLTDEDIHTLNEHPERAEVEVLQAQLESDTTATAQCVVYHVWLADRLEQPPYWADRIRCKVNLVKRLQQWMIRMEGPLQNEK
ncbi:MAG: hypothetical protein NC388_01675 [Clostridium sp.]|nr:hypothetical protein [Clostridium sp.]